MRFWLRFRRFLEAFGRVKVAFTKQGEQASEEVSLAPKVQKQPSLCSSSSLFLCLLSSLRSDLRFLFLLFAHPAVSFPPWNLRQFARDRKQQLICLLSCVPGKDAHAECNKYVAVAFLCVLFALLYLKKKNF